MVTTGADRRDRVSDYVTGDVFVEHVELERTKLISYPLAQSLAEPFGRFRRKRQRHRVIGSYRAVKPAPEIDEVEVRMDQTRVGIRILPCAVALVAAGHKIPWFDGERSDLSSRCEAAGADNADFRQLVGVLDLINGNRPRVELADIFVNSVRAYAANEVDEDKWWSCPVASFNDMPIATDQGRVAGVFCDPDSVTDCECQPQLPSHR
jgi:hypothetical protein